MQERSYNNELYNEPRRVVHVMSELRPGGVEVRTLELLTYLRHDNTQHEVVTISGQRGELTPSYLEIGINVEPLKLRSFLFIPKFVRFLLKTRPNVVHSHIDHSNGLMMALAKLAGVPVRISHYRSDTPPVSTVISRLKRTVMKYLTHRFATVIAGVSPTVLTNAWSDKWEDDPRCCVLLNGFDTNRYLGARPSNLRAELGIDNDDLLILHVGRGISTKNRDRAISILGSLTRQNGPKYRLVFIGRDGADSREARVNRTSLTKLAQRYDVESHVYFAGERPDIARVLRSGNLLLVTSQLEGLPGVVLEAAASQLPIVASDLPGVRFIANNGVPVTLVSLHDDNSVWVTAIEESLNSSTNEHKGSPGDLGTGIFDMKNVASSYLQLWQGEEKV